MPAPEASTFNLVRGLAVLWMLRCGAWLVRQKNRFC